LSDILCSLWVGSKLSTLERICACSWIYHGHQLELFVYDDIGDVPEGVVLKDANAIIPEKDVFLWRGCYAIFAGLFRWTLLYEQGGYWVDMDMLCIKPFDFKDDILPQRTGGGSKRGSAANNRKVGGDASHLTGPGKRMVLTPVELTFI